MNRIAWILGNTVIYWNALAVAAAAALGILAYWALTLEDRRPWQEAATELALAVCLSMFLSRLIHWHCRPQGYENALQALTDYSRGSFALIGCFAGCLLTALILGHGKRSFGNILDRMAVAGALSISVGRLGALFTEADRGIPVPGWVPFPFAVRMTNQVSGETEVRLAVFMLQALAAGILFLILLALRKKKLPTGDLAMIFLTCCSGLQVLLDSTRYDSLYLKSNGFVSLVQIASALMLGFALCYFAVRLARHGAKKKAWLALLAIPLLAGAGYMEYYVQRHGSEALFAYSCMGLCLALLTALILWLRRGCRDRRGHFSAPRTR